MSIEMGKKAILIVGHGSRYTYNKNIMLLQKERLEAMGFGNIYIGFNEASKPTIQEAMSSISADGFEEVIAVPFFIASGLHMTRDIPPKLCLSEGQREGPVNVDGRTLIMHFDTPFGDEPLLAQILKERIALASTGDKPAVMVVGHGSRLPYNKEIISLNASRLSTMGLGDVYYAFNEFNDPKIEPVLEEALDKGADEVLVVPLFISLGDHLKNDIPPKIHLVDGQSYGEYNHKGRKVIIRYLLPIGEDPRLTEVLAEKIKRYL